MCSWGCPIFRPQLTLPKVTCPQSVNQITPVLLLVYSALVPSPSRQKTAFLPKRSQRAGSRLQKPIQNSSERRVQKISGGTQYEKCHGFLKFKTYLLRHLYGNMPFNLPWKLHKNEACITAKVRNGYLLDCTCILFAELTFALHIQYSTHIRMNYSFNINCFTAIVLYLKYRMVRSRRIWYIWYIVLSLVIPLTMSYFMTLNSDQSWHWCDMNYVNCTMLKIAYQFWYTWYEKLFE